MIFLICFAAFLVSTDIFLVWNVGGFTLRLFQLVLVPVLAKGIWDLFSRSVWPIGFGKLLVWTSFIVAFVPNTTLLSRNISYALWLLFSVLMVLGITAAVNTREKVGTVLRWYVYSYAFSAAFGLSQFLLPLVGFEPFLVTQWWFPEVLARINGFTYEPSYYATYMIAGWVAIDYLRMKSFDLPYLRLAYWLVTAALILCSSRMGWMVMLAWIGLRSLWCFKARIVRWRRIVAISLAVSLLLVVFALLTQFHSEDLTFLARGVGLGEDIPAYSVEGRWETAKQTLQVFADHPIVGVSLGGVAPAIGQGNYITIADNADAKVNEGQCTTAEVLAASGVIGFIFYALYIAGLFQTLARSQDETITRALGWGLLFLLVILQFNQNILRTYVWFHIGLLSAAYRVSASPAGAVSRLNRPAIK